MSKRTAAELLVREFALSVETLDLDKGVLGNGEGDEPITERELGRLRAALGELEVTTPALAAFWSEQPEPPESPEPLAPKKPWQGRTSLLRLLDAVCELAVTEVPTTPGQRAEVAYPRQKVTAGLRRAIDAKPAHVARRPVKPFRRELRAALVDLDREVRRLLAGLEREKCRDPKRLLRRTHPVAKVIVFLMFVLWDERYVAGAFGDPTDGEGASEYIARATRALEKTVRPH